MKAIVGTLLSLLVIGSPALAGPPDVKREGTRVSCSPEPSLDAAAVLAVETECFAATAGVVRRDGNRVVIKLASGTEKAIEDNVAVPETSEAWRRVILTDFDAAHGVAVIHEVGYETSTRYVLDLQTGDATTIGWLAHFSPSGTRFASIVNDQGGDSDFEMIVIDVAKSPFKTLAVLKPGTLARFGKVKVEAPSIDFVGWRGEARIDLRLSDGNDVEYARLTLAADAKGRWSVARRK